MKYFDKVYGEFEITEPVLLELIESPALQRLKNILQGGYGYRNGIAQATRFEHSMGAMCLLQKFGASLEEQICGLIHDVSHSAFSHTIDYALEDVSSEQRQCYQDNIFDKFVREKTNICEILEKHGLDVDYILDEHNFPLQETELPELCADRIDYSLRDGSGYENKKTGLIENLIVKDKKWVFNNFKAAKNFAEFFEYMNRVYYSNLETAAMFSSTGQALKCLLQNKLLSLDDLYTDDWQVVEIMKKIALEDDGFVKHWERMNNQDKYVNDPDNYEETIWLKSRAVDPLFLDGDKLKRVSEVDLGWKEVLERESKPKQYFLRYQG